MIRRRSVRILVGLHLLAGAAVAVAPRASASSNAAVLNWTGLADTYGVPIGDYYLSLASTSEQIARAGPHVSWDPASWMAWTVHALTVLGTHWTVASVLTAEAGLFVGVIAVALVILRITVSAYWLMVIGEIARAISGAVIEVTTRLGLVLITVPVGVFAGVVTIKRGESGRGWTMMLIAVMMPALSLTVFSDPAGEMYGPKGILAFGRRIGFSVAEAAAHNGQLDPAVGADGQVNALTASLITHAVREPLQLWNFGHVVDRVGSCGAAWSSAIRVGAPDGPVHAMGSCGDTAAMVYAQHLDNTNAWIGSVFVGAACLLGLFVVVSGWAVLRVSVKAIWTTVILLPALWLGSIPGAPQRRAVEVVWEFFRHGLEVMAYIVYTSVVGLAIERLVSRPLPADLGGANPFAHVLIMAAASLAALFLLRQMRSEMSGHAGGQRLLGRAAEIAVARGIEATAGAAGRAGFEAARSLRSRLRSRHESTPWDGLGGAVDDAPSVHGAPHPGWEPILPGQPTRGTEPPRAIGGSADEGRDSAGADDGGLDGGGGASLAPVIDGQVLEAGPASIPVDVADEPRPVPPVAEPSRGGEGRNVAAPSDVRGATGQDDPAAGDDAALPPAPPTTVDPITDNDAGDPPQR